VVSRGYECPSTIFVPKNNFWLLSCRGADTKYKYFVSDYLGDAGKNEKPAFCGSLDRDI